MDARKARPEPVFELAERRRAEVRTVVGVHAAVVAFRLHVVDLIRVEQLGAAAGDDGHLVDRRRVLVRALAQALDDAREPVGIDGLEQVVERLDRERIDGVLRMRRHEDDRRRLAPFAQVRRGLETGSAGHLHVEEDDVVGELPRQLDRFGGARRLADHPHVGMRLEQVAKLGSRRRLVVDDQRANRHTGTSSRTTVPNGNERRRTPSP